MRVAMESIALDMVDNADVEDDGRLGVVSML